MGCQIILSTGNLYATGCGVTANSRQRMCHLASLNRGPRLNVRYLCEHDSARCLQCGDEARIARLLFGIDNIVQLQLCACGIDCINEVRHLLSRPGPGAHFGDAALVDGDYGYAFFLLIDRRQGPAELA